MKKISIYYIVHTVINMALLIAFRANDVLRNDVGYAQ